MYDTDSRRNAVATLIATTIAGLAAAIFVADTLAGTGVVLAVLYVAVVLLAARFYMARGVLIAAAACIGLTALSYTLSGETAMNASISVAAIVLTSFLALQNRRAVGALRQSEKQWREVFEHNPVMYFMVDAGGTVLSVNAFGAEHLGYAVPELLGKSVLTVFFEEDREIVKDHVAVCLEELGRSHNWEIRKIRKDGTTLWVRENAKAVRRPGNDVIVLIACEDITERRRAEQRRDALYAVTHVLAEVDSLNAAAAQILPPIGENLEWDWGALWTFARAFEGAGTTMHCHALWHTPDMETAEFDKISRERTFIPGQGRIGHVWQHATPVWISDAATDAEFLRAAAAVQAGLHGGVILPILLDTETLGVVEFFSRVPRQRDEEQLETLSAISSQIGQFIKRQRAELSVRAAEERWRTVFETAAIGIAILDLNLRYVTANTAYQRMIGYTEDELRQLTSHQIVHEDHRVTTREIIEDIAAGRQRRRRIETRYRRKDGQIVWADVNTFVVTGTNNTLFLASMAVDITDRKRAEAALRASEERWRTVFERATVGIVTLDSEARYVTANASFQRMTGYTENELRSLTAFDITHEDDRELLRTLPHNPTEPVSPSVYEVEKRYRRKDGQSIWVYVNSFGVPATESTPAFFPRIVVDITDRKRAEEGLRASEERWRALFERAAVGIVTVGFDNRYVTANASFQRFTGYTADELRHLTVLDITHEDDRNFVLTYPLEAGSASVYEFEKRYRRKDGQVVWAYVNSFVIPAGETTAAFIGGIVFDITQRKRTEEALRQAQADLARVNRVMLLGEMTASIAHEVNQPIAAIITNANGGLRWLGARPPNLEEVRQALGRIVRDGTRAGGVIHRVREMARRQLPVHRSRLDLNEAIREAVALTQAELQRHGVELRLQLSDDLPLVASDRVQLQQVIINLVMNAVEAMDGRDDDLREITIHSVTGSSNDVVVEVQDTGPGVDSADLDRLFQSFYTTKPDGIGLGLAISRSIIEAHGGRLSAMPNEPRGAVFRFALPVGEPASEPVEAQQA